MLMALLPLAGWAQTDISDFSFEIEKTSFEYSGATPAFATQLKDPNVIGFLTKGTHYKLVYYKNGEKIADDDVATEVKNIGNYEVAAEGIEAGGYTGETVKVPFTITQISLTSDKITIADFVFTACRASEPVSATYDGEAWEPTATVTHDPLGALTLGTDYTVTYANNTNAGTATVTFAAKTGGNFVGSVEKTFPIAKKAVSAPLVYTIEGLPTKNPVYNAAEQPLSGVTVKVKASDAADAEVLATYTPVIEYYTTTDRDVAAEAVKNAATYYLKIKEPAEGVVNYSFTDVSETYVIDQKDLTMGIAANDKVYDGAAFTTDEVQLAPSPLATGDAIAEGTTTYTVSPAFASKVGSYSVKVDAVTIMNGETNVTANYNIIKPAKAWNITEKDLTIKIKSLSVPSGTAPNDASITGQFAIESTEGAVEADKATLEGDVTIAYDDTKITPTEQANDALEAKTFNEAIKGTAGANELWANYNVTITPGALTILGKGFTVIPSIASVQYGTPIKPSYTAFNEDLSEAFIDKDQLKYEYKLQSASTWSEVIPTAVGDYDVRFKENTIVGTGVNLNGTPTPNQSVFSINPKELTVIVNDKGAFKGDDEALFLANLKAAGAGEGKSYTVTGLVGEETIDVIFSLDETVIKIAEGKIEGYQTGKSAADASIQIAITGDGTYDGNYIIKDTYTRGKLEISETLTATLKNDGTAPATIATGVANGSAYNVTISGRSLKAMQWNAMVLPFAVKPLDFCNAIGKYAVFNTLDKVEKDASDPLQDKIFFTLEMDEIPANTPFLVKPFAAVEADFTINGVTFEGTGEDPVYTGVVGAKFTGTYKEKADIESTNWWALQGGNFKHFGAAKANGLKFTNAFIELTSGALSARFFVEELGENGATAIKSLNVETMESVDMDGWYTVGGVKLQGAPTEKGVYIQNGKKVVIK